MTFLAPATGLLGAAVALPLLILFYLLKLRRRPVRVSSTLLWERATHDLQVNAPLRWLRPSWLLLVQLLALLAFLGALARPALTGGGPGAARVLIVIDCSASMSATDGREPEATHPGTPGGWTRLDEAKKRAADLVQNLRRSGGSKRSEGMVVALAASARTVTPFTSSTPSLSDAIRSIDPTDQPGRLNALRRIVRSLGGSSVAEEEKPTERTLVYLVSDGAFEADDPGGVTAIGGVGVDFRLSRVGPDPSASSAMGHDNLGIVALSARRDYDDPASLRLFVRVQSALARPVETALELSFDGEAVETRPISLSGAKIAAGVFDAGEAAATFELTRTTGGVATVSILRRDRLASDNRASLVLEAPHRPAVLVVGPGGPGDRRGVDPFLLSVLQELDLSRLVVVDRSSYESMAAQPGGGTARERDEGPSWFDLIVFDQVRPGAPPTGPTLSFGAATPIPGLSVTPIDPPEGAPLPAARFLAWHRTHPVMRDVGLDPVVVAPPMRVAIPTGADRSTTTVLAQGTDGPLLVLVEEAGIRRIVVGFELARSNWGPDVSFPVFIANAVDYLTLRGQGAAGRAFRTIDAVTVSPRPGAPRLAITGPVNETIERPPGRDDGPVSLGILDRAGLYSVEGASPGDETVAVNLTDAFESRLATADWGPGAPGTAPDAPGSGPAGPREIWPWFVLAGLLLASVEWLLYAWRMRA